ncbi:hypothetical protein L950_0220915 [Sphingobacterium sp. IITKGP-BTPF85]|nr:hypothetical protein L950_0220915 [Sphingobacterium sp. IITKGP-BTPF85]
MDKWVEMKLHDVVLFSGGSQPPKSTFSNTLKEGYIRLIQIRDYKSDDNIVMYKRLKQKNSVLKMM